MKPPRPQPQPKPRPPSPAPAPPPMLDDEVMDAAVAIYEGRDAPVARYARPARTTVARVLATCARGGVL